MRRWRSPDLRCARCGRGFRPGEEHSVLPDGRVLHVAPCRAEWDRLEDDLRLIAEREGEAEREVVAEWTRRTSRGGLR